MKLKPLSILADVARDLHRGLRHALRPTDEQLCNAARNAIVDNDRAKFLRAVAELTHRRSMINVAFLHNLWNETYADP